MATPKPTMQPIDWKPELEALEAILAEIKDEAQKIQDGINQVIESNRRIDEEIEEIFKPR